ncbi:IS21 family transposase [Butyricicoccus sp. 1XD8-22]|nr:IS21 family transposase [Butyricicoccus sp. 1XD8-22]
MLAMSEVNCIKTLRNEKGLSISAVATAMKVNWRTAKKYGDGEQLPQEKLYIKKGMMYEEKWGEIVSDWLEEDLKVKKKLRRTNKKMYEDLQSMGFEGSYRTVCNYIQEWRSAEDDELSKGHERLNHPEGEAQLDFGTMEAVQDGEIMDVHALVMSFPASNTGFAVPMPGENLECFLSGLQQLFKQAGGVPISLRIDNLTPAVKKVRKRDSEAELTEAFLHFQNYYGFQVQVCNPESGNEKGHVERKVGYVRYNFFSTPPVIKDLEDLGEKLEQQLKKDRQRLHYKKEELIEDLWIREQKQLLKLPEKPYPVFKQFAIKFNKYNEFKLDQHFIHVPRARNYVQLYCITYWDKFKVITNDGEILLTDARPYMKKRRFIPWKDILKDWLKKPRVIGHSRYTPYLPTRIKEYLTVPSLALRKQRINQLITLLVNHDMKEIDQNFYDYIAKNIEEQEHPYGVNWTDYDALSPKGTGVTTHE